MKKKNGRKEFRFSTMQYINMSVLQRVLDYHFHIRNYKKVCDNLRQSLSNMKLDYDEVGIKKTSTAPRVQTSCKGSGGIMEETVIDFVDMKKETEEVIRLIEEARDVYEDFIAVYYKGKNRKTLFYRSEGYTYSQISELLQEDSVEPTCKRMYRINQKIGDKIEDFVSSQIF